MPVSFLQRVTKLGLIFVNADKSYDVQVDMLTHKTIFIEKCNSFSLVAFLSNLGHCLSLTGVWSIHEQAPGSVYPCIHQLLNVRCTPANMHPHLDVGGRTVDVQLLFGLPMDACDFLRFALVLCVSCVFRNFLLPLSAVKYESVPCSLRLSIPTK